MTCHLIVPSVTNLEVAGIPKPAFVNGIALSPGLDRGDPPQHPWVPGALPSVDEDVWELYDTIADWSQAHDLAAEQPEKLEQLKQLFLIEAVKYGVLPLDDRRVERFNPNLAGRPTLIRGNDQLLFAGMAPVHGQDRVGRDRHRRGCR